MKEHITLIVAIILIVWGFSLLALNTYHSQQYFKSRNCMRDAVYGKEIEGKEVNLVEAVDNTCFPLIKSGYSTSK